VLALEAAYEECGCSAPATAIAQASRRCFRVHRLLPCLLGLASALCPAVPSHHHPAFLHRQPAACTPAHAPCCVQALAELGPGLAHEFLEAIAVVSCAGLAACLAAFWLCSYLAPLHTTQAHPYLPDPFLASNN
jgi:hypothetical protein